MRRVHGAAKWRLLLALHADGQHLKLRMHCRHPVPAPQLDRQAHALAEAEERAGAAEAAHQQALLDIACLKRGLELAAEQLTRSAGTEVPGTLLRAVARVSRSCCWCPAQPPLRACCCLSLAVAGCSWALNLSPPLACLALCPAGPGGGAGAVGAAVGRAAAGGHAGGGAGAGAAAPGGAADGADAGKCWKWLCMVRCWQLGHEWISAFRLPMLHALTDCASYHPSHWPLLQQQTERAELVQRAEAAEAAAEKQRAAARELRKVLDALR